MAAFEGFCERLCSIPEDLYPPGMAFIKNYSWDRDAHRKPAVEVQLQDALTLRYSFMSAKGNEVMRDAMLPIVKAVLDNVDWLKNYFIAHLDVARLRPSGSLKSHIDRRYIHSVGERILIPMTNSPQCSYWGVGSNGFDYKPFGSLEHLTNVQYIGEPAYLTVGNAYRLNNRMPHKVENAGDYFRVNLVVDLLPPTCTRDPVELAKWYPLTDYERNLVWPPVDTAKNGPSGQEAEMS